MMTRLLTRLLPMTAIPAVLLTITACGRPYEMDPLQINARYTIKYKEPCSAWLRSAKTGYLFCSSPAFAVVAPGAEVVVPSTFAPMSDGPTDEASLKSRGQVVYTNVCATCHMIDGKGTPGAFPPLAGSGSYYGDPQNHARIIVHGLSGSIVVQGVEYTGAMPAQGGLSDYDIAAAATYERLSWGNNDGVVMPADVAAVRR